MVEKFIHVEVNDDTWCTARVTDVEDIPIRVNDIDYDVYNAIFINDPTNQIHRFMKITTDELISVNDNKKYSYFFSPYLEDVVGAPNALQVMWADNVWEYVTVETVLNDTICVLDSITTTTTDVRDSEGTKISISFYDEHGAYDIENNEFVYWRYSGSDFEPPRDYSDEEDDTSGYVGFTTQEYDRYKTETVPSIITSSLHLHKDRFDRLPLMTQNNIGLLIIRIKDRILASLDEKVKRDLFGKDIVLYNRDIIQAFEEATKFAV